MAPAQDCEREPRDATGALGWALCGGGEGTRCARSLMERGSARGQRFKGRLGWKRDGGRAPWRGEMTGVAAGIGSHPAHDHAPASMGMSL